MTRKKRLYDALSSHFLPVFLDIQDESGNHRREGTETHFKIIMVSAQFEDKTRIMRHRAVNALAEKEFETGLHAFSLHLYTPAEWEARGNPMPKSPLCHQKSSKNA